MPTVLENKPDFLVILQDIDDQRPILRDAWVDYEGERWYPVMVRAQKTRHHRVRETQNGFQCNGRRLSALDFSAGLGQLIVQTRKILSRGVKRHQELTPRRCGRKLGLPGG